jgi:cytochrome c peroxidase
MTTVLRCLAVWAQTLVVALASGCGTRETPTPYVWELPERFPMPRIPADNPMTVEKVELGRHLFYDPELSDNGTQSCGSCHRQELAFTDGRARAVGSTGEVLRRSSMSLVNVAYNSAQTWANPRLKTLEMQAAVPILSERPVELGFGGREAELLERLRERAPYRTLFGNAFPEQSDPFSFVNLIQALASFERSLISGNSAYDRYASRAEPEALSEAAQRGARLFFGERFECHHCHGLFSLTGSVTWEGKGADDLAYTNDALYNLDGHGAYPSEDQGLLEISLRAQDMGKFRAPTLRNIALTAPYMHDGSIATLRDVVVDHYARGGRVISAGPNAGDGALSPLKGVFLPGFEPTEGDIEDLLALLEAFTDEDLLQDPRLADPW